MRCYTVHLRRPLRDPASDVVLVREGFAWGAFAFTVLWALANRLWLVALLLFTAEAAVVVAARALDLDALAVAALSMGLAVAAGYLGNDLRRWTLEGRGFGLTAVVTGGDHDAALARFLDRHDVPGAERLR